MHKQFDPHKQSLRPIGVKRERDDDEEDDTYDNEEDDTFTSYLKICVNAEVQGDIRKAEEFWYADGNFYIKWPNGSTEKLEFYDVKRTEDNMKAEVEDGNNNVVYSNNVVV